MRTQGRTLFHLLVCYTPWFAHSTWYKYSDSSVPCMCFPLQVWGDSTPYLRYPWTSDGIQGFPHPLPREVGSFPTWLWGFVSWCCEQWCFQVRNLELKIKITVLGRSDQLGSLRRKSTAHLTHSIPTRQSCKSVIVILSFANDCN